MLHWPGVTGSSYTPNTYACPDFLIVMPPDPFFPRITAPGSPWITIYFAPPKNKPVGARVPGSSKSFNIPFISSGFICIAFLSNNSVTIKSIHLSTHTHTYLREGGALGPHSAVVAKDGRRSEFQPGLPFDIAHQVLIHVSLPRHIQSSNISIYVSSCFLSSIYIMSHVFNSNHWMDTRASRLLFLYYPPSLSQGINHPLSISFLYLGLEIDQALLLNYYGIYQ